MKSVLAWRVLPVLSALALSAFALVLIGRASSAAGAPARLPDLVQQTPRDLEITRAGTGPKAPYVLGFRSAVSNIGDGALVIEGHRRGPEIGTMIAGIRDPGPHRSPFGGGT